MDIHTIRERLKTKSIYDLPLRVTFYARVSTEKDEQLNSLDNQISYYENFIKTNKNWTYVNGYLDEGITGLSTKKRENFHNMIEDGKLGKFDYIITKEITRFARNTLDSIKYTRDLLKHGVAVFFQNDNINTVDEDSELRLTIMASLAQDESRRLSSRVKFGHNQAIQNGVVLGNSRIIGYKKSNKRLVVDETQAQLVKDLFEMYASGEYSLKKITDIFWERGYRNTKGTKILHNTLGKMIQNPKYKGYYVGNKVKIVDMFTKKQKFLPEEDWVMYKDSSGEVVPALVSEQIWNRANEIFKERSEEVTRRKNLCNHPNLLTGKMICIHCNRPYYRHESKRGNKNSDSKWICSGKLEHGANSCPSIIIYEEEMKQVIYSAFCEMTPDDVDMYIDYNINIYETMINNQQSIRDSIKRSDILKQKIQTAEAKKNKLLEYNVSGRLTDDDFLQMNKKCTEEIKLAKDELSVLEHKLTTNDFKTKAAGMKKTLREAKLYANASLVDKDFVGKYIDKIYVSRDGEKTKVDIQIFTGENTSRYLDDFILRTGHTFKKMIPVHSIWLYRNQPMSIKKDVEIQYEISIGV